MINNMDNLNKLSQLLGADRIVSKDDLNEVLKAITNILSEYKKELSNTSKEQENAISYLLAEISAKHDNLLEEYKSIKEDTKEEYDEKCEEVKSLIEEVKLLSKQVSEIEVKDGKDADEEKIISEVLSQIKLPEYKETIIEGGDIVDKINALPVNEENQIDAKHIKNLPEVSSKVISGGMTKKRVQDMIDASGVSSPLTTKGDLYTYSTTNARLPVGTNGKVLSADSTEATGLKWITVGTGDALTTNPLSQFAATTSAQLAGVISDETGSGALVFANSPTLVTPTLGVASATSLTTTGNIELGHASDTTLSRSSAGVLAVEGVVIPSISSTNTLTNKRITKRVGTTTSSATPTINTDNVDMYTLTAQTVDITSFTTNLSGTPTDGQTLWIAITGTAARAITWGTSFEASTVALPTTTVSTNRLDVGFVWNAATSKWRCVASV